VGGGCKITIKVSLLGGVNPGGGGIWGTMSF